MNIVVASALFLVPAITGYLIVKTVILVCDYRDRKNGKTSEDI